MPTSKDFTWDTETEEFFRFVTRAWDVREAKRIIASKRAREVFAIPVDELRKLVGEPGKISLAIRVDWEAAKTADVTIPIILAQDAACIPIDGYHRIARAVLDGLTELPAVVLTKTESKKVRLP